MNPTNKNLIFSESRSYGMYSIVLGGLLHGLGNPLGVTLSADESCDVDGGSLASPYKKIDVAGTVECTSDANMFLLHIYLLNHGLIQRLLNRR